MAKTVSVVLGGTSGMGFECARELGKRSRLIIFGRNQDLLRQSVAVLKEMGIEVYPVPGDISKMDDVKKLADFATGKGDVKYVVNAAGINGTSKGANVRTVFEVDALGTVNAVEAFYPVIVEGGVMVLFSSEGRYNLSYADNDGQRHIFNQWRDPEKFISSMSTIIPEGKYQVSLAYCVAKEFVAWFTKVNVTRFGEKGCRIVSVSPGSYETRMRDQMRKFQPELVQPLLDGTPVGHRFGRKYEMANLVDFLCSDKSSFISGTDILADGGYVSATMRAYLREDQILDE